MGKLWTCVLCDSTSLGSKTRRSKVDLKICQWCEGELARTNRLRCRRCNVVQPCAAFKPSNPRYCYACRHAENLARRAGNTERRRQTRAADPTLRAADAARTQKWRDDHPERSRAAAQRQYRKNRDRRIAYQRAYHQAHREQILAKLRQRTTAYHRLHRARHKLRILRGTVRRVRT